jgi:uncharacterized alpha-E superfamily protein
MAIIAGIVSQEDKAHIVHAGYTLADHTAVLPLLTDMQPFGAAEEEAVAVWIDGDVTDLLVLDETLTSSVEPSERTVKVTADSVRKVADRMGATLADHEAERIAAQVAAHLREVIEDEIVHAIDT